MASEIDALAAKNAINIKKSADLQPAVLSVYRLAFARRSSSKSDRNRNGGTVADEKERIALDVKLIDFSFCRFGREGVLPALRSAKMPGLRERGGRNLWLILTAAPPCVRKFSHARFSNSPQCHSHRSTAYMDDGGSPRTQEAPPSRTPSL